MAEEDHCPHVASFPVPQAPLLIQALSSQREIIRKRVTCKEEGLRCVSFHLLHLSGVKGQLSQGPSKLPQGHAAWRTSLEAETPLPGFTAQPQTAPGHECISVFMGPLFLGWTHKLQSPSQEASLLPLERKPLGCALTSQSIINILTIRDKPILNIDRREKYSFFPQEAAVSTHPKRGLRPYDEVSAPVPLQS
ncbi:hypothetical protein SRHO_G00295380 [Serrasalmus rhombeus]